MEFNKIKLFFITHKRSILLGIGVLFAAVSVFAISYTTVHEQTSTKSDAAGLDELNTTALQEGTVVAKDTVLHVSLYKSQGYLYKAKTSGEVAAEEFIARNPKVQNTLVSSHVAEDGAKTGISRGERILPTDLPQDKVLERSSLDTNDTFLKKKGIALTKQHYYYSQTINDIPVFGASVAVHIQNNTDVYAVDGDLLQNKTVTTQVIAEEEAEKIALAQGVRDAATTAPLVVVKTQKYIFNKQILGLPGDAENHLTLAVTVGTKEFATPFLTRYFVDLATGEILYTEQQIREALNRKLMDSSRCTSETDPDSCLILRAEGQAAISDAEVNSAYDILGDVYNYYKTNFQRDSFDNSGAMIKGFPHWPANCPNAAWMHEIHIMVLCNGFAVPDVLGHEMTHALTEQTANFVYSNQSGALDEGIADMFGSAIDGNWTIGEASPLGIIRYLDDPTRSPGGGQPDRLFSPRYICSDIDQGGVHMNNGVVNKAFYLMTQGGTFNGCTMIGIGTEKSHAIIYRALTTYFSSSSNFKDFYDGVNRACNDLYQAGSGTCVQVDNALKTTELDQQPESSSTSPVCTGLTLPRPVVCSDVQPPTGFPSDVPTPTEFAFPTDSPRPTLIPIPSGVCSSSSTYFVASLDPINGVSSNSLGQEIIHVTNGDGSSHAFTYATAFNTMPVSEVRAVRLKSRRTSPPFATIGIFSLPITNQQHGDYYMPDELLSDLQAGQGYIVVETEQYPDGELAGDLQCLENIETTPTTTPIPTNTPIPTSCQGGSCTTPVPTNTPSPTYPPALRAAVALSVKLQSLGIESGDSPVKNEQRNFTVELLNENESIVKTKTAPFRYNLATGTFLSNVDFETVPPANYIIKIKTDTYLKKRIPGIYELPVYTLRVVPRVDLVVGDVNGDNFLDIRDYNSVAGCFGGRCGSSTASDLNEDGVIDVLDVNIIVSSLAAKTGD